MTEQVTFKSGSLDLEGVLTRPEGKGPFPAAVIAPPHPQFGGSMENNVVHALEDAFVKAGALTLRFNFRGVGGSDGAYGEVHGEAEDLIAAGNYVSSVAAAGPARLILGGYSFGGLACFYALAKGLKPDALVLVSPMFPEEGFLQNEVIKDIFPVRIPMLILSGELDELFDYHYYEPLVKPAGKTARLVVVKNADHFWAGQSREIKNQVSEFLNSLPVVAGHDRSLPGVS